MYTAGTASGMVKIKRHLVNLAVSLYSLSPTELHANLPEIKRSQNRTINACKIGYSNPLVIFVSNEKVEGVALTGQVDKVGEAANIAIKAEPNKVAPGGKTTINISLTDANSRGVVGEELNVMSSSGSIENSRSWVGSMFVTLIAPDSGSNSLL